MSGQTKKPTNKFKNCYLCDYYIGSPALSLSGQIFATRKSNGNTTLATVISDILSYPIEEDNVHSKVVCNRCQQQCSEFELLSKRLTEIRANLINSYNKTAIKHNLKTNDLETTHLSEQYDTNTETVSTIPDAYSMDDVNFEIATESIEKVFSDVGTTNKLGKQKNIVLIKTEDSPLFTMSDISNIVQGDDSQEQAFQTVILEEINDTEFAEQDPENPDHFIITEPITDSKEFFDAHEEQMIEVSTNGNIIHDKNGDYQSYVFQEESEDEIDDSIDDTNSQEESIEKSDGDQEQSTGNKLRTQHFEIRVTNETKDELSIIKGYNIKGAREMRMGKGNNTNESASKRMFVRDGLKFQCLLCEPATDVIYDTKTIAIHLKSDHNERVYVCSICGADFRKRNPYKEHIDDHILETRDGTYECEICETMYSDVRVFRAHKKSAHSASMKIWTCKECTKTYSSKNLLDEHMNMHTGERPYKCPYCVKDFASKYTLTAHMKIHYDRKRPYECKECGKSFFSNQNLTQHERTHTAVKEYECDVCNKKFGTPHNLDVHKIVHTGYKPFICRTCGKAFARRAEIKDHERTHTGERPYKCDMCESSFAQRSNLMSHKRATHFNDKRYKCETCDRSFKRRRLLEYHIKATHTGERPYKCEVCNSTFVYPEHFKKHVRIHSGLKPFTCEVCGKSFNSRDNRNAHRYVHSDKKPFECLVCGTGFMRKPLLYAHMEARNHLNDTIIINQPHINDKNDKNASNDSQLSEIEEENSNNDNDIVYLNLNDDLMDEDEYTGFEEEHIIDDGEIVNEEHLIIDGQFSNEQKLVSNVNDGGAESSETDSQRIIEGGEDDPLHLVQICVSGERDNVSWVSLVA